MSKHTRTHHRRHHKRSATRKHHKSHRRHARGGFLAKASVPFSLFGLQHYFSKKHRRHSHKSRKTHRKSHRGGAYSMVTQTCANPNKRWSKTKKGCIPRKCAPGQIVARSPITDLYECVANPFAK